MESETWKEALDEHLVEFTERLPNVIDEIIMRMRRHFSNEERQKMKITVNPIERIKTLVDSISTRTEEQFNDFCQALVDVKQSDLAEKLSKSQNFTVWHI